MDSSGLSQVVLKCWLPEHALGKPPAEGEEPAEPGRKEYGILFDMVPKRLKESGPKEQIKTLTAELEAMKAKEEAGECTAEETKEVEDKLTAASSAFSELNTALVKDPITTLPWMDSLMAYCKAGCTTVCPSGPFHPACNPADYFSSAAKPFATNTKVLAKFLECSKLEKGEGVSSVMVRYVPNLWAGDDAAAWVEATCVRLGVESLEHVQVHWWDEAEGDVAACLKALKATEKVAKVSLAGVGKAGLVAAHLAGCTPASVELPALAALAPACAPVLKDCKAIKVPVLAANALLGGLVSAKYVGKPEPLAAEVMGTPLSTGLAAVNAAGGWAKFQGVLKALGAAGPSVESAMIQVLVDSGLHPVVETPLDGAPTFAIGEPLAADKAAAIIAAMSA